MTYLVLLLIASFHYTVLSVELEPPFENLDVVFISKLRLDLRLFPKSEQCVRLWTSLSEKLTENGSSNQGLKPNNERVIVLARLSQLLSRNPNLNSLSSFIDDCIPVLSPDLNEQLVKDENSDIASDVTDQNRNEEMTRGANSNQSIDKIITDIDLLIARCHNIRDYPKVNMGHLVTELLELKSSIRRLELISQKDTAFEHLSDCNQMFKQVPTGLSSQSKLGNSTDLEEPNDAKTVVFEEASWQAAWAQAQRNLAIQKSAIIELRKQLRIEQLLVMKLEKSQVRC